MTHPATSAAVRREITVQAPPERAFEVFTHEMATWWPRDTHHVGPTPAIALIEPFEGGRCLNRADDGTETQWGRVLAWEPPERLLFAWMLTPQWTFEPDVARSSEVEVTFEPAGGGATRVRLEHRGFERYAEGGEVMRAAVDGPGGWDLLLGRYRAAT